MSTLSHPQPSSAKLLGGTWPTCSGWLSEAQFDKIEFFDECVDRPNGIVFGNPVLESLRKQHRL